MMGQVMEDDTTLIHYFSDILPIISDLREYEVSLPEMIAEVFT